MPDPLADSTVRLERLLEQAMMEREPEKCDALCAEIWQILGEREHLKSQARLADEAAEWTSKRTG